MLDHFESQVVAIKGTISFTFNGQCRSLMQQPQWQSMTPYPFMAALIVCMYYACSIFFVEKLQLASIKMPFEFFICHMIYSLSGVSSPFCFCKGRNKSDSNSTSSIRVLILTTFGIPTSSLVQ
jgi:hypothetical protein